jgi:hypothetical protein
MLLPDIYHTTRPSPQNTGSGGLIGDLPIFLALVALSLPQGPQWLPHFLSTMFRDGVWQPHQMPVQRIVQPAQ